MVPKVEVMVAPTRFISGQKRHRELAVDAPTPAVEQSAPKRPS